ncbi:hypothetical protein DM02DRAFT_633603 [Periconia macrospinosa]|uniref:Cohesin loading factor-domain-containing protein n=1 Tax=Periconia macrospinosa TaxID=97972 RepID=A0A2V1D918_9PLEO|nr:hypothetical protein DM02DRAFT_633603 [Periconia macrospinosa]
MDPRFNWPPQQGPPAHPNGQYGAPPPPAPPSQHAYPQMGYGMQYPPQQHQAPHMMPQSQPMPNAPRVVVPPRASQQYPPTAHQAQGPRPTQPQVVIPPRNPNPLPQMQPPRIRQVQVQVPRPVQRASSGGMLESSTTHGHARPPQGHSSQMPGAKPVQRSQSFQENPRPQNRPQATPTQNHNQHRAPLQPQGTPSHAHAHTPTSANQHRSPASQSSSIKRSHPQVVIKRPSSQLQTPTRPHHAPPKSLPADLIVMILSAADEYIAAARSLGSLAAMTLKKCDLDQYYKLMATAMGCMEAVLKKYNQSPRDEALLRLRYASLLVEETDNNQEIEETLAKGIALCNRSRLHDLKYAMLHLQARYQFKSSPRSAFKLLEQPIQETETFQHTVWLYAFRFLKATLALQVPGRPETASALHQLHTIAGHAERKGDRAIFVTCCALEAMIHLRGTAPDKLEHAQRALASARSLQLQLSAKQLGQVAIMIDCIDIACTLQNGQPNIEKLQALQAKADQDAGPANGVFSVLIEKSFGGNLTFDTGGVFTKAVDGRDELVLSWLPRHDLKILAYYLSGLVALPHERGNSYLQEGHRIIELSLHQSAPVPFNASIPTALRQRNWLKILDWHIKFAIGIVACYHEDKSAAKNALTKLQERISQSPFHSLEPYARTLNYLSGVLDQCNGSIESALDTYSSTIFNLPDAGSGTDFKTDVAILATINRLLIVRDPSHPEHYQTQVLFAQLQPLCANHPNLYIDCAFRIVQAITIPEESINRQKTLIHTTTNRAQKLGNMQFMSICLNYMASRFFANQVGEQPIKSVRAARNVSKQGRSVIWRAVAYGICMNTFQRNGLFEDATACQIAFEQLRKDLPTGLTMKNEGSEQDAEGDVDME